MRKTTLKLRASFPTFLLLFVACLAVAPVLTARGAVAQEPAPVAAQPAADGDKAAQAGGEQQEEGENKYRHSGLVKSIAKSLGWSVETTARTFEIINVGIVVLGLGIPLVRILPKVLRQRREKLSSDLESARKQTADANQRLSAVEEKLKHLDAEIAKYRAEIEAEMQQDESRIKSSIEEEKTRIVASAEQEIGVAAAQARRGLKHFAAELAVGQAAKQLTITPETDRALIAQFVSSAGRPGDGPGGKN